VALAAAGARTPRNLCALLLAVGGVLVLTDIRLAGEPLAFVFAFGNAALFMAYVVLGHRVASDGTGAIDRLGAAMLVAAVAATPVGFAAGAGAALLHPDWLLWGIGVGICSSVIPYVADQLAMARLPRATFALMLCLLPAVATAIGLLVLGQVPTGQDLLGIAAVIGGVALHHSPKRTESI
jgi:inner membrane transporter RhtA